jgi:hypothetical protein
MWMLIVALILFVLWPPFLLQMLLPKKALARRDKPASWKWTAVVMGVLMLMLIGTRVVPSLPALPSTPVRLLVPVLAGLLWGTFLIVNLMLVFPPVHGLSRIRFDALKAVLEGWVWLSLLRCALLLLYVPIFMVTLYASEAAAIPERITTALVLPTVGLVCWFWFLSLVDNLSVFLDEKLVEGSASVRNEWHPTIRKYFMGYVRRNGISIDRRLIEYGLFLPGRDTEVTLWGGGFAVPRILVGQKARETALGELPDEPEAPERTTNPEEAPFGTMLPSPLEFHGRAWSKKAAAADAWRRKLVRAPPKPRVPMPRLLGEAATALGWVMPQSLDESVPLISNTKEDYEVVKSLLTEHYGRFEKNLDEDEHDDTDPSQKDFLFGALLVQAGRLTRRDNLLSTIALSLRLAMPRASIVSRKLMQAAAELYARFLAWPAAVVGDAYAALNQALHPTIQYLDWVRTPGINPHLTARADGPRFVETSKTILDRVAKEEPKGPDRQLLRPSPRNRMLWLSPFFYAPLTVRPPRWRRALGAVAAVLTVGTIVTLAVQDAIEYHPTYVERMTQMQAAAEEKPPSETKETP